MTLDIVATGYAASLIPEIALGDLPAGVEVLDVPELRLSREVFALVAPTAPAETAALFLRHAEEVLDDLGFDSRLSRERPDGGR